jgi:DNA-binding FadR family transcriptional regulator
VASARPSSNAVTRLPKAATILADQLRRQILIDRLPSGAELPREGELIQDTGLSRGVVREALRLLEADGLITIRRGPRGGVTVTRPDTHHITQTLALHMALSDAPMRDLFAFRRVVEPAAAALAARNATDEQRELLLAIAHPEPDRAVPHNVDFHMRLADATNNEFFRLALTSILELTLWHSIDEGLPADDLDKAAHAHHRIAGYVAAGEADSAERGMRKHIEAFEALMEGQGRLDRPVIRRSDWGTGARQPQVDLRRKPTSNGSAAAQGDA